MPSHNIEQFTSPVDKIIPSEQGEEAAVRAGRLKGAFFHELGDEADQVIKGYQETQGNEEISKALPLFAGASLAARQKLDYAITHGDPADPTTVIKASQDYWDNLQQLRDQFHSPKGSQVADQLMERDFTSFHDYGVQAQSKMAAAAAWQGIQGTINAAGAEATLGGGEHLFHALGTIDTAFDHLKDVGQNGYGATLDASGVAELEDKRLLAKQETAVGALRLQALNGDTAGVRRDVADLNFLKGVLGDKERAALLKFANDQDQSVARDKRDAEYDTEHQQNRAAEQAESQFYTSNMASDGTFQPSPNAGKQLALIGAMPGSNPGSVHAAQDAISRFKEMTASGENNPDNPGILRQFDQQVGAGTLTHDAINAAFNARQISKASYERYTGEVEHVNNDPAYGRALADLNRAEQQAMPLFGISDTMSLTGKNLNHQEAFLQWTRDNRASLDIRIHNDKLDPEAAADSIVNASNSQNRLRAIQSLLSVADKEPDVPGMDAYFLANPTPLTLDQVAITDPAGAAAEAARRAAGQPTGNTSKLTPEQKAFFGVK